MSTQTERPFSFFCTMLLLAATVAMLTGCSTLAPTAPKAEGSGWSQDAMAAAQSELKPAMPGVIEPLEVETAEMTAAHTTLPIGSTVRVTRLDTGRDVIVRITKRVPSAIGGQLIQLAHLPAEQLDLLSSNMVPCRIDVLKISVPQRSIR